VTWYQVNQIGALAFGVIPILCEVAHYFDPSQPPLGKAPMYTEVGNS